jgi:MazG family protein
VAAFAEVVRRLRAECPWDREQTHASLRRHLLEESYEVLEAIDHVDVEAGTGFEHLEEELGDLLFQVVFHATLAAEAGQFTLADVARTVHDKLVVRHPHVFGDVTAADAEAVMATWEQRKKVEKGRSSVFDGIPGNLPSLLFAYKVQRKAASVGVDVPAPDVLEPARLDDGDAVGSALFAVVAAARRLDVDPETALRSAAARFLDEARAVEAAEHRR